MHIHDWSIKKKLLLSHFLMIGIPVFIVMVVILGILFSFLMATGSQKPTGFTRRRQRVRFGIYVAVDGRFFNRTGGTYKP